MGKVGCVHILKIKRGKKIHLKNWAKVVQIHWYILSWSAFSYIHILSSVFQEYFGNLRWCCQNTLIYILCWPGFTHFHSPSSVFRVLWKTEVRLSRYTDIYFNSQDLVMFTAPVQYFEYFLPWYVYKLVSCVQISKP